MILMFTCWETGEKYVSPCTIEDFDVNTGVGEATAHIECSHCGAYHQRTVGVQ